jgi:hypothetical protein
MLPIALVCPFLIASLVFSLCCQLLLFVHFVLPLSFSLYVANCSGLSIFDCPFGFLSMLPVALICPFLIAPLVFSLCCQLLWFVLFDCLFGFLTMLPVVLACPF